MNDENLISIADRPEDEKREITRKGGQASGEARRQRKTMRERLEYLMTTPNAQGIEHGEAIAETLIKCATDGNMKAAKLIGDYCGDFKQRIEVEDTTPTMSKEEAAAIYWEHVKQHARKIANGEKTNSEAADIDGGMMEEARRVLAGRVSGRDENPVEYAESEAEYISNVMNYCDPEENAADLVHDLWNDYTRTPDYQNAIQEAAKMSRDDAGAHLANAVKEYRAAHPYSEKRGNKELYYSLLVIYLCARSEQWRKDHPDQAAPPPPRNPNFKPAPGQPYPEDW